MDKAEWYLKGVEKFGWRYRLAKWFIWLFYRLKLIGEDDVKMYANFLINAKILELCGDNVKVKVVEIGGKSDDFS